MSSHEPAEPSGVALPPAEESVELARELGECQGRRPNRLDVDEQLVLRVSLEGLEGPTWERLRQELARYGLTVIAAWIKRGHINRHRLRLRQPAVGISRLVHQGNGVQELAADVVVAALQAFLEDVLLAGKWDSSRGASLKTFFVGTCLLVFPNAHRAWTRRQRSMLQRVLWEAPAPADLEAALAAKQRLGAVLAKLTPAEAELLRLDGEGWSHAELAEREGCTPKAIEGRLRRIRGRIA